MVDRARPDSAGDHLLRAAGALRLGAARHRHHAAARAPGDRRPPGTAARAARPRARLGGRRPPLRTRLRSRCGHGVGDRTGASAVGFHRIVPPAIRAELPRAALGGAHEHGRPAVGRSRACLRLGDAPRSRLGAVRPRDPRRRSRRRDDRAEARERILRPCRRRPPRRGLATQGRSRLGRRGRSGVADTRSLEGPGARPPPDHLDLCVETRGCRPVGVHARRGTSRSTATTSGRSCAT